MAAALSDEVAAVGTFIGMSQGLKVSVASAVLRH
jgi:hypothetical protein